MSSVRSRIDSILSNAGKAQESFSNREYETSAKLYKESFSMLRTLLNSGEIKDEKSFAFLRKQLDEFKVWTRKAEKKAQQSKKKNLVKKEVDLKQRLLSMRGKQATESELHERFAKLKEGMTPKKSNVTEQELTERLQALGPSQFPQSSVSEAEAEDPRVKKMLEEAMKEATSGFHVEEDSSLDPELAASLAKLDLSKTGDDELFALLGAHGVAAGSIDDAAVDEIIKQTKDYVRFGGAGGTTAEEEEQDDGEKDILSSSDYSTSDSDSDNPKRKSKKKKTTTRKSWFRR